MLTPDIMLPMVDLPHQAGHRDVKAGLSVELMAL